MPICIAVFLFQPFAVASPSPDSARSLPRQSSNDQTRMSVETSPPSWGSLPNTCSLPGTAATYLADTTPEWRENDFVSVTLCKRSPAYLECRQWSGKEHVLVKRESSADFFDSWRSAVATTESEDSGSDRIRVTLNPPPGASAWESTSIT